MQASHSDAPSKQTICLNMIVKNESAVIERCLKSLKSWIDYWVIVDTGSTDHTQEIIRAFMSDVPGELHERSWVNFAHNRNEALELAKGKGDYLLFIDADEVLEYTDSFSVPKLDRDFYYITVRQVGAADVKRIGLVKNSLNWKWQGILHEVPVCPEAITCETLKGVINLCNTAQGSRSKDPQKYLKDAQLLEKALQDDPTNSRYAFYTAMSYLNAKEYALAQKFFQKRLEMPSSDFQETYFAIYNLGGAQESLGDFNSAIQTYFQAYASRPTRAEPLFRLAILYRKSGNFLLGYLLSQFALTFPYPSEDLCVEYLTYDHAILIEYANCTLLLGRYEEGLKACNQLLANPNLPEEIREQVISNCALAQRMLSQSSVSE